MTQNLLIIRSLGLQPYLPIWQAMQRFTDGRVEDTTDEIWLLEHEPVFTQGQNGKAEHLLNPGNIPVIQTDRGGQITYHGPGQLMVYTLIDLKRKKLSIRDLVCRLEQASIAYLQSQSIESYGKKDAPGVYVQEQKICSIGLRVRKGCAYHGIAFNVAMDLGPFTQINPCGYQGLKMTQLADLKPGTTVPVAANDLINFLVEKLAYNAVQKAIL